MDPALRWTMVIFCLISIAISGRQALWYLARGPADSDLRIFLTGVEMVRSGYGHELYRYQPQQEAQIRLYPETRNSGLLPFNHLAFELLFYWPLAGFSYRTAFLVWALANVGLIFLIARLLCPTVPALTQATGIPLAMLLLAFYPVIFTCGEGQDSILFLLFLVLSLRSLTSDRRFLGGFLLALACFKFHLVLAIAFFVLGLRRQWTGVAGFITGGAVAGAVSLAMVGPAMFRDYPAMLSTQAVMTPWGFVPWYMPNLRGILEWALARWLDIGAILPIIFLTSAIIGVVAAWFVLRSRARQEEGLTYSVAILTTILVSYHLHMQDLTMAFVPMVVLADRALRPPKPELAAREGKREVRRVVPSTVWTLALATALAALYVYRLAAELIPYLLFHGCVLAVPILALWVIALREWSLGAGRVQEGREFHS